MSVIDIIGDVTTREIVLYGNKDDIQAFLRNYNDILNIKCIISEYMDDVRLQTFEEEWNLHTFSFDELSLNENQFIIICSKKYYASYVKRLLYSDKKEYLDYVSMELVECILHKKKLVVCMGTQLIRQVTSFLCFDKKFSSKYHVVYFAENELAQPYINRMQEAAHICKYCDIYISSSCEKDRFNIRKLDGYIQNNLCIKVKISDYGFKGYFPQITDNRDKMSDYLLREHERYDMDYEILSFARVDSEILTRIENGLDCEKIFDEIVSDTLFTKSDINEYFDKEIKRFSELEINDDIQLSRFISDNRALRLCRNYNEWNEPIISYVANELLAILGEEFISTDASKLQQIIEEESGGEIVIYPCVEKSLGLADKKENYKVVTYYTKCYMNRDEYLRYHIKYLYEVYNLLHYTKMYLDLEK